MSKSAENSLTKPKQKSRVRNTKGTVCKAVPEEAVEEASVRKGMGEAAAEAGVRSGHGRRAPLVGARRAGTRPGPERQRRRKATRSARSATGTAPRSPEGERRKASTGWLLGAAPFFAPGLSDRFVSPLRSHPRST